MIQACGNWAGPLSLAATKGISVDFFSSGYLDVSVLPVRLYTLWIQIQILPKQWVSPFGNLRIKACLSTPRSLSQTTTSFIASYRLGIHRMRLFAWPYNLKQSVLTWFFARLLRRLPHSVDHVLVCTLSPSLVIRLVLKQNLIAITSNYSFSPFVKPELKRSYVCWRYTIKCIYPNTFLRMYLNRK